MTIKIHKLVECTFSEGPGKRFAIWVQGCNIHCAGCANREMWDHTAGKEYEVSEIVEKIRQNMMRIEGVTFLGGEPFEQIQAIREIVTSIKPYGLSVLIFTGYRYEELLGFDDPNIMEILHNTDVLVDGRFDKDDYDLSRPWVGSANQRYLFLSDRYSDFTLEKNRIEIRITKDSRIEMIGMANIEVVKSWF